MANGTRIRELLMLERDGKLTQEQAADVATLRGAGRFPSALQGPATPPARPASRPMRDLGSVRGESAESSFGPGRRYDPRGAGEVAAMEGGKAPGTAYALRTFPGMAGAAVGGTLGASIGYGAGEAGAQALEKATGERAEMDPLQIGVATALPAAVAGVTRAVRGGGRTLTRLIPSRFRGAHQEAFKAAGETAEQLAPEVNAGQLFEAARKTGAAEVIPAGTTSKVLASLDDSIPKEPVNAGLKAVREHMGNVRKAMGTFEQSPAGVGTSMDSLSVKELMKLRRDIGADLTKAKEMGALYKGIITDLEEAAAAGGPSASMAKDALTVFKRDLGVARFNDLVEGATQHRAIFGADTPVLNVAKLAKSFSQNQDELTQLVGPEGMQLLGAFVQRFKSLPPDVAYNGWGRLIGAVFGAGGVATGNVVPAAGAALGLETLVNAALVGKTPGAVNQAMNALVEAARAGAVAQPDKEVPE